MEYYSAVTRGEAWACGEPGKHAKCEKSVTSGHGLYDSICMKCHNTQSCRDRKQVSGCLSLGGVGGWRVAGKGYWVFTEHMKMFKNEWRVGGTAL